MDFILTKNIDLKHKSSALNKLSRYPDASTSHLDEFKGTSLFAIGGNYISSAKTGRSYFFDGQFSANGQLFHDFLENDHVIVQRQIDQIVEGSEAPPNGIFFVARLERREDPIVTIVTDWLGQYPIYVWDSGKSFAVSNNIHFMSHVLPGLTRSMLPAICGLATGGALAQTPFREVRLLKFGHYLRALNILQIRPRADHQQPKVNYEDYLAAASDSIKEHARAVWQSIPSASFVADITGGGDSRAILSFLLPYVQSGRLTARCQGSMPSPDANVAGMIMERFGLSLAQFPTYGLDQEKVARMNAGITAGARGSLIVPPIAYKDLVHFRGSYGEIGGKNSQSQYITEKVLLENPSSEALADIVLNTRRMARATQLLTKDALSQAHKLLSSALSEIEERTGTREALFSELYVRSRCRSHFGLSSYVDNRARILPELLANRWLFEAGRSLPLRLSSKNKAIFDLTLRNSPELTFMPMAEKKWNKEIVPADYQRALSDVQPINESSPPQSKFTGKLHYSLYQDDPQAREFQRTIAKRLTGDSVDTGRELLKFFLNSVEYNNEIWQWFDRDVTAQYALGDEAALRKYGLVPDTMAVAACAMAWQCGLEVPGRVVEYQTLAQ